MKKLFILMLICLALFADDIVSKEEWVREHTPAREMEPVEIMNDYLRFVVDCETGETEEGGDHTGTGFYRKLTFGYDYPPSTSWYILKIDTFVLRTGIDSPPLNLDPDTCYVFADTIHVIANCSEGVRLHHKYSLESIGEEIGDIEMVKHETFMVNIDSIPHDAGFMRYWDTMINRSDDCEISTTYSYSDTAKIYYAPHIPAVWRASEVYPYTSEELVGTGIPYGFEGAEPDVFWYGQWGASCGNFWDDEDWIHDTGLPFGDSAVMLKWNQRTLNPGDSVYICTYYGISTLETDSIHVETFAREMEYSEDSVTVTLMTYIINNMFFPITENAIECDIVCDDYTIVSGSDELNFTIDYIHNSGGMYIYQNKVRFPIFYYDQTIPYTISCDSDEWEPSTVKDTIFIRAMGIEDSKPQSTPQELCISAYPNPFNSSCYIELPKGSTAEIFDIEGKLVDSIESSCNWSPSTFESGVYTIRLTNSTEYKRIIYMK